MVSTDEASAQVGLVCLGECDELTSQQVCAGLAGLPEKFMRLDVRK